MSARATGWGQRSLNTLLLVVLLFGGACTQSWTDAWEDDDDDIGDDDDNPPPQDEDGDGVPWPEDCHDGDPSIYPGADEDCDGLDNDCNGVIDDAPDGDQDGYGACEECDDENPGIHPGASDPDGEEGDGVDNDCDGDIDEGIEPTALELAEGIWLLSDPLATMLTGSGMIDMGISQSLEAFFPPQSELMLLLFELISDGDGGVIARLGPGQAVDSSYDWVTDEPTTPCSLEQASFACLPLEELSLGLPTGEPLLLRQPIYGGSLAEDTGDLDSISLDGALLPAELPELTTAAGSLAESMANRPLDVDTDGDGIGDAWSVSFRFRPLDF